MKKEDLIKLKEKINQLSIEEKKLRNLYLRKLSSGELYGPMTGYSSIDKPWLKCFNNDSINALIEYEDKDISMYEQLYNYGINHLDDIILEYLGNEITYRELLDNINKTAIALINAGASHNDIIPIILPNCPEARYLIYACSKIGAIPNPIMPTINSKDLLNIIESTKCKKIFIMNGLLDNYDETLKNKIKSLETVIEVNPLRNSNGLYKILYLLNGKKNDQFDLFLNKNNKSNYILENILKSDIALIEQTGGTTGITTKGVVITNKNVYASNYQLSNGGFNFNEGDSILDILLPSISYGAAFEHLTLCNNIKNYMVPILVKKQINKYISKYRPNHIMMGPIHFEFISKDKHKRNWHFIKNIVSGGDEMSLSLEHSANNKLRKNNSKVDLEQGYGESECFGACACNHQNIIKSGSVGIPHLLTTIAAFKYDETLDDYTTDEELPLGVAGELCINGPTIMKEYLNNPKATSLVLKKHSDGTIWLHTGDIGYIDNEGYVYITERIKDLIFRNGFKVSPKKINNIIKEEFNDYIDISLVLGIPDEIERNVPVVFIKLKDNVEQENTIKEIKNFIFNNFKGIEEIKELVVLENIPRTSAGKIDKKQVKKEYLDAKKEKENSKKTIKKLLIKRKK